MWQCTMKLLSGAEKGEQKLFWVSTYTWLLKEKVFLCKLYRAMQNDGAVHALCYISTPSQLIALAPATSLRLHMKIHYANDSQSC